MTTGTTGQETTADNLTALEKEVKVWEAKQKIAESEQAIAEANLAKLKTLVPSGSTKPVEGKITTDEKSGYAAELAAYNAMRRKARFIADIIAEKGKNTIGGILLVDSLDYCVGDIQLLQISTQIESFSGLIDNQIQKFKKFEIEVRLPTEREAAPEPSRFAPAAILPLVPQMMSAAADVLGYFRMDYEVKGKTVTRSDVAFRAMVAGCIPYPVYFPGFHSIDKSNLLENFNSCVLLRHKLALSMAQLNKIIGLMTVTPKPKGDGNETRTPTSQESLYAESEALVKMFDEFGKSITSVPAGNTLSPLASAITREYLKKSMELKEITHLLYLTITSAGGEQITGYGPFNLCGKIWYMGGCVVNYVLADLKGRLVASDAVFESSYVHYSLWAQRLSDFSTSSDYLKPEKK